MRHLISITQLSKQDILQLVKKALHIKLNQDKYKNKLKDKLVATLFFEPSTRTRLSFISAALRLGAKVFGFDDASTTSTKKGETLEDTIKIVSGFADIIIIRHPEEGSAKLASSLATIPVINAGDGSGEHPTQALLDIFTIFEHRNPNVKIQMSNQIQNSNNKKNKQFNNLTIKQLKVAFVGDLKYGRTVHSLSQGLAHFNPTFYFISPPSLKMPREILATFKKHGVNYNESETWDDIAKECDVLYMTRVQKERFENHAEYERLKLKYILNKQTAAKFPKKCIFMHPLPRVGEIDPLVDSDPRAMYFKEAHNGVWVRMALLLTLLDVK